MSKFNEKKWPTADNEVMSWAANDYVIRVFDRIDALSDQQWAALLAAELSQGRSGTPFMTPEYLAALQTNGCASPATGWTLCLVTLWEPDDELLPKVSPATETEQAFAGLPSVTHAQTDPRTAAPVAACALYIKTHSYGEYVFDWSWADAYQRYGVPYYPKGVVTVPFTPVPGPRLLARQANERKALLQALPVLARQLGLSSLHMLFAHEADLVAARASGWLLRQTVQFHWQNTGGWRDFDGFLASLNQDKRKKIRQERRKVRDAGVSFRWLRGTAITPADWDFFYRCYERTYLEHGNPPYLNRRFFADLANHQPDNWLLFIAIRTDVQSGETHEIACSLIAISTMEKSDRIDFWNDSAGPTAYGRYWGALERVDCLHFEACYYQPIEWCIANNIPRFEGGAQGEHKMARALMPVPTTSAHWLAHPGFADAIERHLHREADGVNRYLDDLASRSPFKPVEPPCSAKEEDPAPSK